MTTPVSQLFSHHGSATYPAESLHTTPLGYDRRRLTVGQQLPLPPAADLVARIDRSTHIHVALHGKLGDSLLALAAVRAASEWIAIRQRRPVPVTVTGPHTALITRSTIPRIDPLGQPANRQTVVIANQQGTTALDQQAGTFILCDPAQPPCWSTDSTAHPDLPARHYLALERRLGTRLPATAPFTPLLYARPNPTVQQLHDTGWLTGLTIAAITATSRPDLKDYGTERFIETAERIAHRLDTPVRLLLIGGTANVETPPVVEPHRGNVHILRLEGMPAADLADLLPYTDLVVGNDTGLTHLAALARQPNGAGPHVIGLYARHSHSKWRTGLPHHHAIATTASELMHQGDLCVK